MPHVFKKHYTRAEASALLPQIRLWFKRIGLLRADIERCEQTFAASLSLGADTGGAGVNSWISALGELKAVLFEFAQREIQIKSLDRGLIDFPSILEGREVFLCWEQDEPEIEFWHDLDSGFGGRERLPDI